VEVLVTEAVGALDESTLVPEARHALGELAVYVARRDR
jgi:hypothetical protein